MKVSNALIDIAATEQEVREAIENDESEEMYLLIGEKKFTINSIQELSEEASEKLEELGY